MYHSITFGDKNTWDDWKIVPKTRPLFKQPPVKTNYVDIPGASSKLDFSEALTGYPLYENRTGTFEFYVLNSLDGNEYDRDLDVLYSQIANYIHGKRLKAYLEDDPEWYYEGRFSIEDWAPGDSADNPRSSLTINYDVGPYKWFYRDSIDTRWEWDPFSFVDGIIVSGLYGSLSVSTQVQYATFTDETAGNAPFSPTFIVTTTNNVPVHLRLINPNLGLDIEKDVLPGTTSVYDFVIYGPNCKLYYSVPSGTGTLSIKFQKGGL